MPSEIRMDPGSVFVVSEWHEDDFEDSPVVRGVCSSLDDFYALLERLWVYEPKSLEQSVLLKPAYDDSVMGVDPDKFATSEVLIMRDGHDELEETGLYVWDSAKSRVAYAPLKLYWCTTDEGEEDWFIISHTAREAELQHAANEGFDLEDPSADFVMVLPPELQAMGNEVGGWPTMEMLVACGATVIREDSPRVVELAGRTFTEGMMDRLVDMVRAGERPEEN